MLRLRVDRNKCTNCRFCESACTFTHYRQTVLKDSRIEIIQRAVEDQSYTINVCHQCSLCPPLDACPTSALTRDPRTGVVHLNAALCPPGCRLCVPACPLGAILEGTAGLILCDFCGGDPACVQVCYTEALFLREYALTARGLGKRAGTQGRLDARTPEDPKPEEDHCGVVASQLASVPAS
jgi:Fe-S-cluster-containing hydrogenase component 2